MILRPRLLLAMAFPLAGCAATRGDYPSLSPRSVESAPAEKTSAEPAAPDPAIVAEIAPIIATAEKGHADFRAQLERTRATIDAARGAAAGSEAWVAAQTALSTLDSARGPVLAALADLDALGIRMAEGGRGAGSLAEAVRNVEGKDAEERNALTRLGQALAVLDGPGS
jgi:hypothetical protein